MAAILLIFLAVFLLSEKKICILIQISLKFVPMGPIYIMSALMQVMAWHSTGDDPLLALSQTQSIQTFTHQV